MGEPGKIQHGPRPPSWHDPDPLVLPLQAWRTEWYKQVLWPVRFREEVGFAEVTSPLGLGPRVRFTSIQEDPERWAVGFAQRYIIRCVRSGTHVKTYCRPVNDPFPSRGVDGYGTDYFARLKFSRYFSGTKISLFLVYLCVEILLSRRFSCYPIGAIDWCFDGDRNRSVQSSVLFRWLLATCAKIEDPSALLSLSSIKSLVRVAFPQTWNSSYWPHHEPSFSPSIFQWQTNLFKIKIQTRACGLLKLRS